MIDDKFTDKAHVNYERLGAVIGIGVRALDEILSYGYDMQPLDLNRKVIDDWRSIGLGIFGLADALVAMGIRYGSEESIEFVSEGQGIQDAMWAPKAKKVMENGQMLIVRDGVKYNALGTAVE